MHIHLQKDFSILKNDYIGMHLKTVVNTIVGNFTINALLTAIAFLPFKHLA